MILDQPSEQQMGTQDRGAGKTFSAAWFGSLRTSTGTAPTDRLFAGQTRDLGNNAFYHFPARYLDTTIGKFHSPDTIVPDPGNPQALNRYSYVLNQLLKLQDPTGHAYDSSDSSSDSVDTSAVLSQDLNGTQYVSDTTNGGTYDNPEAGFNAATTEGQDLSSSVGPYTIPQGFSPDTVSSGPTSGPAASGTPPAGSSPPPAEPAQPANFPVINGTYESAEWLQGIPNGGFGSSAWDLPNDVLAGILAAFSLPLGGRAYFDSEGTLVLENTKGLGGRLIDYLGHGQPNYAMTIGHVIFSNSSFAGNPAWLAHESGHVRQSEVLGPGYLLTYAALEARGYQSNSMEQQARTYAWMYWGRYIGDTGP